MSLSPRATDAPLRGVRVLEVSHSRPARTAGQLLADLGADVVRLVVEEPTRPPAIEPADVSRDRGKRVLSVSGAQIAYHVATTDILIVDRSPSELEAMGLRESDLRPRETGFVYVWAPPYGPWGEWAELEEDPLLLAAAGGVACQYPGSQEDALVAPVVASTTQVHGGLAAAASLAGLYGLERTGHGYAATVSGLHATAAVLTAMTMDTPGRPMARIPRSRLSPNWRSFSGSDDRWFYLATLTPDQFLRAISAIDRLDLLELPDVGGDVKNLLSRPSTVQLVNHALEEHFRTRPSEEWIALLSEHGVAVAPVQDRESWSVSDIVAANGGFVTGLDTEVGRVRMPNTAILIEGRPPLPGALPPHERPAVTTNPLWDGTRHARRTPTSGYRMPLTDVKVIDAASFVAGPLVSSLLAEFGADVAHVEPPTGDAYRVFPTAFFSVNRYKRGLALKIPTPEGAQVMLDLLRTSDILVENLRPERMARIGLDLGALEKANPHLVHVAVSAYGQATAWADAPGYDPVFQALSGMAVSQGGDGYPYDSGVPVVDTATATLGAVGALAGLWRRLHDDRGARIDVSLAQAATFLQFNEFTTFSDAPDLPVGGPDHRGPDEFHRLYACTDGWIAVHAAHGWQRIVVGDIFGVTGARRLDVAIREATVAQALSKLAAAGVPAVRGVTYSECFTDPSLEANGWLQLIDDDGGRALIMRGYSDWSTTNGRRPATSFPVGESTIDVLTEAGLTQQRIRDLLDDGIAGGRQTRTG